MAKAPAWLCLYKHSAAEVGRLQLPPHGEEEAGLRTETCRNLQVLARSESYELVAMITDKRPVVRVQMFSLLMGFADADRRLQTSSLDETDMQVLAFPPAIPHL